MSGFRRPFSSASSMSFIDVALSTTDPYSLSYVHRELKGVIREHILSLLDEFITLSASSDDFTQEDGATVHLLRVHGSLPLACSHGTLNISIWVHQSYPFAPPIVFLSSASSTEIDRSNPFIDASGNGATTPYLITWQYPNSNLLDLVRNMVTLFTRWPPFVGTSSSSLSSRTASLGSKREVTDQLYVFLSRNLAFLKDQTNKEMESLRNIQEKLRERESFLRRAARGLDREKKSLNGLVKKVEEKADVLRTWLRANNSVPPAEPEAVFEVKDKTSALLLHNEAEFLAIEDVVFALDEALMKEVLEFSEYIKQVRKLFRKQFIHVAVRKKLEQEPWRN